jgi:hypothetical protein
MPWFTLFFADEWDSNVRGPSHSRCTLKYRLTEFRGRMMKRLQGVHAARIIDAQIVPI